MPVVLLKISFLGIKGETHSEYEDSLKGNSQYTRRLALLSYVPRNPCKAAGVQTYSGEHSKQYATYHGIPSINLSVLLKFVTMNLKRGQKAACPELER